MPIANCAELQQTIQFQSCANILLPRLARRQNNDAYAPAHPPPPHTHSRPRGLHTGYIHACQIRSRSKLINNEPTMTIFRMEKLQNVDFAITTRELQQNNESKVNKSQNRATKRAANPFDNDQQT